MGYTDFSIKDGIIRLGKQSISIEYGDLNKGVPPKMGVRMLQLKLKQLLDSNE